MTYKLNIVKGRPMRPPLFILVMNRIISVTHFELHILETHRGVMTDALIVLPVDPIVAGGAEISTSTNLRSVR